MSFQEGSATGVEDLLDQWFDFLLANGWTADIDYTVAGQSPDYGVINRKIDLASPLGSDPKNELNIHAGFAVSNKVVQVGPVTENIHMVPMRDYGGSGDPGLNAIRGSNFLNLSTTTSGRVWLHTNFPSVPFEKHWFFEGDFYAHCVVEYATGFYRHFGLGQLNKTGKYFGGEYYYCTFIRQDSTADNPIDSSNFPGFDSLNFGGDISPKVFAQDLDKTGLGVYKGIASPEVGWYSATLFDGVGDLSDSDGTVRGQMDTNGPRKGRHYPLYWTGQSSFNGYRPMYPQFAFTKNTTGIDPIILLGSVPDQRVMSMEQGLSPQDEFTIGADTWIVFPLVRKQPIQTFDFVEQSLSFGVAYKKNLV